MSSSSSAQPQEEETDSKILHVDQRPNVGDARGCTGIYTGPLLASSGLPHGSHGHLVYDRDNNDKEISSFQGDWDHGQWQNGICTFANGDVFTGSHIQGQRQGTGLYEWKAQQRRYQGEFFQNQPHGQGTYTWETSKSYYKGTFVHGVRQGHGVYIHPTAGMEYVGEWKQGKYHGKGVLTFTMKTKEGEKETKTGCYKGEWVQGKRQGNGMETIREADGTETLRHEGAWENDQPVKPKPPKTRVVTEYSCKDGREVPGTYRGLVIQVQTDSDQWVPQGAGTMTYTPEQDAAVVQYEGFWDKGGHYHGFGRLTLRNGDTYAGPFDGSRRHGRDGAYAFADGKHYQGDFYQDARHGQGTFSYPNGSMYQGEFVHGKRQGNGKFTFANGSSYQGTWDQGNYKQGTLISETGGTYQGDFSGGLFHGHGKQFKADGTLVYEGEFIQGLPAKEYHERQERKRNQPLLEKVKETLASPILLSPKSSDRLATPKNGNGLLSSLGLPSLGNSSSHSPKEQNVAKQQQQEEACETVVDQKVWDGQNNPGKYTGILLASSRKPHGVGRLVYQDGTRVYEGFFQNGHRQGHGRCVFVQNGDFHEGQYEQDLRQGPGKYIWKDGRTFVGNYHQDERHGPGTFSYPNGDVYVGNFAQGQRSGKGKFTFGPNQSCSYDGEWKEGVYHGAGTLVWIKRTTTTSESIVPEAADSEPITTTTTYKYVGDFIKGVFHGQGSQFLVHHSDHEDDELMRSGTWEQGKYQGPTRTENEPETSTGVPQAKDADIAEEVSKKLQLESNHERAEECSSGIVPSYESDRDSWRANLDLDAVDDGDIA